MRNNSMKLFWIWTSGSGGNVIKIHYLSRALAAPFSMERNYLRNFGRRHHKEQFCKIILNLDQWYRRRCRVKIFLIWSSGSSFCSMEQNHLLETMFSQTIWENICFQWYHIHKIHTKSPYHRTPRSTLLPSPLPIPLQPVLVAGNQMALMQTTLVLLLDKNNIGILLVCCGFQLWNVNPMVRKTLLCLKTWLLKAYIWLKQNYKFICTSNGEGLNGVP